MNAAPCSWRVVTWRTDSERDSASRTPLVSSPGPEKTNSVPSDSRHSTSSEAAVRPPGRRVTAARLLRPGEDHDPDLRHVVDRVAQSLATLARVLDAAVRHGVDPVRRHVVDDHAADVQLLEAPPRVAQLAGEDAGLEAEEGVVDPADGLVEVTERERDDERSERLVRT